MNPLARFLRSLAVAAPPAPPRFECSMLSVARSWVGRKELPGTLNDPLILAMLRLDASWPAGDEVPWCSAFLNFVCMQLGLPRSRGLAARSWIPVGRPIELAVAAPGFDVVVLKRSDGAPGAEVLEASGHVAAFERLEGARVMVTGGNQGNAVSTAWFPAPRVIAVRRLFG